MKMAIFSWNHSDVSLPEGRSSSERLSIHMARLSVGLPFLGMRFHLQVDININIYIYIYIHVYIYICVSILYIYTRICIIIVYHAFCSCHIHLFEPQPTRPGVSPHAQGASPAASAASTKPSMRRQDPERGPSPHSPKAPNGCWVDPKTDISGCPWPWGYPKKVGL